MLFNSINFVYLFLPVVLVVFFLLAQWSHRFSATWLMTASLFFYGWWNPKYVGLLVVSMAFNFCMGMILAREATRPVVQRRVALLVFGVGVNLLLLGYYKYTNFFLDAAGMALGTDWHPRRILLPLGISFFTFTQIAFLVDAWRGLVREFNLIHYGLFVTYFPHLIAGPVLHHGEMMPQFDRRETYKLDWENVAIGLAIFAIGLFKKIILADGMAPHVSPIFDAAHDGVAITFLEAWFGAWGYALQLYFDFSGYSDMAIGLSRLFGVKLPLNFNSPYQALNVAEFWRRWHMTLSRFLREYLYFALGGNRKGPVRRYVNLMVTMILGGLWHGAGWTFAIWGLLHGFYLVVNHAWQKVKQRSNLPTDRWWTRALAWVVTFTVVVIAWVFFRAESFDASLVMLSAMSGVHGVGGAGHFAFTIGSWGWLGLLLLIAAWAPNTQTIFSNLQPALDFVVDRRHENGLRFQFSGLWVIFTVIMLLAVLAQGDAVSEFLYFQF